MIRSGGKNERSGGRLDRQTEALRFAQRFDIDLAAALAAKMKLNAERYLHTVSRGFLAAYPFAETMSVAGVVY